jgi:hypothetical protein
MLKIGIDDFATEKQRLAGYAYFVLTDEKQIEFKKNHAALCQEHGINVFHGKKYKTSSAIAYEDFLKLTKEYLANSPISLFCMTLNTKRLDTELNDFFKRIFIGSIKPSASFSDTDFAALNSVTPYLLTLQKVTNHMNLGNEKAEIEIDSDDIKKKIADIKIVIKGHTFTGQWFIKTFYNKYRNQLFPNAPQLSTAINVLSDTKSCIIQDADVFANFLLAHFLIVKGHPSPKRQEKSDMLVRVFGKYVAQDPAVLSKILRVGDNDLDLTLSGAITFQYGRQ